MDDLDVLPALAAGGTRAEGKRCDWDVVILEYLLKDVVDVQRPHTMPGKFR